MALIPIQIPKNYKNGRDLYEQNLDAIRAAIKNGFDDLHLNLTQIGRDLNSNSYNFLNNGRATLSVSLQDQINLLASGGTPLSGTSYDTFTINTDGSSATLDSFGLTGDRNFTFPDLSGVLVTLDAAQTFSNKNLGTPTAGVLTNCTGLPTSSLTGLGTGVATFLATPSSANLRSAVTDETGSGALVFATSPTLVTPNLGTPTAGVLTNCTGLPTSSLTGLGTGVATFLATPSSANLRSAVTDETGSGALVFATSPTISSPTLSGTIAGTPSFTSQIGFNGGLFVGATDKIFLDGGGDTSISQTSANIITLEAGGDDVAEFGVSRIDLNTTVLVASSSSTSAYDTGLEFGSQSLQAARIGVIGFDAVLPTLSGSLLLEVTNADNTNYQGVIINLNSFVPTDDNTISCGTSSLAWEDIYSHNSLTVVSDERRKKNILPSDLGLDFINTLNPISWDWDDGSTSKERTYGLGAQSVEKILNGKSFAGLVRDKSTDFYGLRLDQFIPILIKAVQELSYKIH